MKALAAALLLAAAAFAQTPVFGPSNSAGAGGGVSALAELTDVGCAALSGSTFDAGAASCATHTLTGNLSLTVSNETPGTTLRMQFTMGGSGGYSITWPGDVAGDCQPVGTVGVVTEAVLTVWPTYSSITYCGAPLGPDAITMLAEDPANVPTPASGYGTVFLDSTNSNEPSVKDAAGTVTSLIGGGGGGGTRALFEFLAGTGTNTDVFSGTLSGAPCKYDNGLATPSGAWDQGGVVVDRTGNDGMNCRGSRIDNSWNLSAFQFAVWGFEYQNTTDNWDVELLVNCWTPGDTISAFTKTSFSTQVGAVTLTAALGGGGRLVAGEDASVDISSLCEVGDIFTARVQIGDASTSASTLNLIGWRLSQ